MTRRPLPRSRLLMRGWRCNGREGRDGLRWPGLPLPKALHNPRRNQVTLKQCPCPSVPSPYGRAARRMYGPSLPPLSADAPDVAQSASAARYGCEHLVAGQDSTSGKQRSKSVDLRQMPGYDSRTSPSSGNVTRKKVRLAPLAPVAAPAPLTIRAGMKSVRSSGLWHRWSKEALSTDGLS